MGPVAHREQQRVIGNRLVLDLLDRVPAPHALRLGLGTGKMSWIGQYGVGQRRGEMLKRAGSCELHERRAPFGPRDRPSGPLLRRRQVRSEEHTSELQSLMRISYAVFCLKKKKTTQYFIKSNTVR